MSTRYLGKNFPNKNFGILDLDICGPSQPRILGVENEQVHMSGSGWSPVSVDDNVYLMSIGFLLASNDDAIIWKGPKKNGMIRQFLSEVDWGNLDLLILDTPPGTSDEHLSASSYLKTGNKSSLKAIMVTTPSEISLLDVRKEISFCRKQNIDIVGVIENMNEFICEYCNKSSEIFSANTGGAFSMCQELGVPYLGGLPLDPSIAKACDKGEDFTQMESKVVDVLKKICNSIDGL